MIIYEVNLAVEPSVLSEWLPWLRTHISELLALDGFIEAQLEQQIDPIDTVTSTESVSGMRAHYTVRYTLRDQESLDCYLTQHAPRLRNDGLRRFPGQVSASRRVLRLLSSIGTTE